VRFQLQTKGEQGSDTDSYQKGKHKRKDSGITLNQREAQGEQETEANSKKKVSRQLEDTAP